MPANIEIKARLRDLESAHAIARRLSRGEPECFEQTDVFFPCDCARLKLRILDDAHGELIIYERPNEIGPRRSTYQIARTPDPHALLDILQQSLGFSGTVKKLRSLYLVGQSRIHIDQVETLGNFLEVEVVLMKEQTDAEGKRIAQAVLQEFGVVETDLVGVAYVDLLSTHATLPSLSQ